MKLLRKYGLMALTIALISTTTVTTFAQENNNFEKTGTACEVNNTKECEEWTVNDYIKYVKSLNVLSKDEISTLEKAEKEVFRVKNLISSLNAKESLTKEEKNKIENLFKKLDSVMSGVKEIYEKIAKAEGYDYYNKEKELDEVNNEDCKDIVEWTVDDYIDKIKSLNILTDSEFAKFKKVELELAEMQKNLEVYYSKDVLTSEEEKTYNSLCDKFSQIKSGISDIYDKIYKAEQNEEIDKVDDKINEKEKISFEDYLKSLKVFDDKEIDKLVDCQNKVDNILKTIKPLMNKENLTEQEKTKIEEAKEQINKLYESLSDLFEKLKNTEEKTFDVELQK